MNSSTPSAIFSVNAGPVNAGEGVGSFGCRLVGVVDVVVVTALL
jgi:hypothetical protein